MFSHAHPLAKIPLTTKHEENRRLPSTYLNEIIATYHTRNLRFLVHENTYELSNYATFMPFGWFYTLKGIHLHSWKI